MPVKLGGRRFLLSLAITAASVCLALGITLPIIRLTRFVFWTTEHSLLSIFQVLIQDGQTFLGFTILVFSIVFPIVKLLYLLLVSTLPQQDVIRLRPQLRALEWLGKWSMHDVLVLALTIFFIKSQGLYDAASLWGVYFFTAGVLLMILSYAWLRDDQGLAVPATQRTTAPAAVNHALPMPRPVAASAAQGGNGPMPVGKSATARRRRWPFRNFILCFFIILATVFFALGVILPVIRFTTVFVWKNEHSIATIIWALYTNQEYFLCGVLFVFSILFPFLKLFYLLTLLTSPDLPADFRARSIATMEWLGRYSMTDVMVLALMIFYVNSSGYTEARVLPGAYYFAASALITMLAYGWAHTAPASSAPVELLPLEKAEAELSPHRAGWLDRTVTVSSGFAELLLDVLAPLGHITIRNMFSGGGVYCDGIIFGLVIGGDNLFLKADASTLAAFVAEGCGPFVHKTKGRPIAMPYWRMPERLLDEPDEMVAWARTALSVARGAKSGKSGKTAVATARKPKPKPRGSRKG